MIYFKMYSMYGETSKKTSTCLPQAPYSNQTLQITHILLHSLQTPQIILFPLRRTFRNSTIILEGYKM